MRPAKKQRKRHVSKNWPTSRQLLFVEEYIKDLNGSAAAIRAGYSSRSASTVAHLNLKNPKIQKAIQSKIKAASARNDLTIDQLIEEEKKLSFSNIRDFLANGTILPPEDWPAELCRAVKSFEVVDLGKGQKKYTIRLWDKGASLERLERYLGMFKDKGDKPQVIYIGADEFSKPEHAGT